MRWFARGLVLSALFAPVSAQTPTGTVQIEVVDPAGSVVPGATVAVVDDKTGYSLKQTTGAQGVVSFTLPVGTFSLRAEHEGFGTVTRAGLEINVDQSLRMRIALTVADHKELLVVEAEADQISTSSSSLGNVVSRREVVDLPLNGRNFAQLGLLQPGVTPMTAGLTTQGGSRRSGHAFTVNGIRPESNNYLIDGARALNRMDGGFAIRQPIDTIEEFKILTHAAPAEYGGTTGGNTSVVTRSGGNQFHGSLFEFLRNDISDARNFFVTRTEPLKQNQFGGILGGPVKQNKLFFFGYYEGFRNRQGITRGSTVPTDQQRLGDFTSNSGAVIDPASGQPFPNSTIPSNRIDALARRMLDYYPRGNVSGSFYSSTQMLRNDTNQAGLKLDAILGARDTFSARYFFSQGESRIPFSILGSDVPGFPVQDNLRSQLFTMTENHVAGSTVNTLRASLFRHFYLLEKRLSGLTPRGVGFGFDSTLGYAEGMPFITMGGYSNIGDPAIGPRDTTQNDFEVQDAFARSTARHNLKFGVEFRRTQVNSVQGHYANGAFSFTNSPSNNPLANFLLGRPSTFTQAGGDFYRGLRSHDTAAFAQDSWRWSDRLTVSYGVRWEINTPFSEIRGKLNAFAPGQQSTVFPTAPAGILVPGDPGVPDGIAPTYRKSVMPRVGIAYDPSGDGQTVIRAGFAMFYDLLLNGVGGPLRVATQSLPWVTIRQASGANVSFSQPLGPGGFTTADFGQPMNIFTLESNLRPPYAQDWNLSIERNLGINKLDLRYVGTKGTRLPRFVEANPAVYGPGATAANAGRRRIYSKCPADTSKPCDLGFAGVVTGSTNSTYHGVQAALSRRFQNGLSYNASYTFSKLLDYVSSLHIAGPAPILVSGEMDLAQNPFDLNAEHGPSLFDSRHRLTVSTLYDLPALALGPRGLRAMTRNWQWSGIATWNTGTPFTVYDSRNVSLQAAIPPVAGMFGSRPDLVQNPNAGSHTVEQWVNPAAFRRLDAVTEAGRFGNAGRNVARGPGRFVLDCSLVRHLHVSDAATLQLRLEAFNATNHTNLGTPVNDMVSPNFGRIVEAGPARLFQVAAKFVF
jgi:hypothetical protein